jgi:predicted ATP-grasp superfamily ATP-dependent carboligase
MRIVITNATVDRAAAAARALRAAGFEVYGVDSRRVPGWMVSRHLHGYGCIDCDDPVERQDAILRFIEQTRADVFLPLCTPGAIMAVQRRSELDALCRLNVPDADAFLAAFDKRACMHQCAALGIPTAGSLSRDEAAALLVDGGDRSVIIKPATDVGAARGLRHVADVRDLDDAIHRCTTRYGTCLIQEYVPGGDDAMSMVTVVYSAASRLLAAFTARKVRQWPPGGGVTAYGISTRDDDLLQLVRPFFDRVGWRGPAEVELKLDPRDGTHKVLEINPRLPGYLRHASLCGVEPAVVAVRAAVGEDQPPVTGLSAYREGVAYVAPAVFASSVRHHADARGWWHALRDACRQSIAAGPMLRSLLSDPLPMIVRTVVPMRPLVIHGLPASDRYGDAGRPMHPERHP